LWDVVFYRKYRQSTTAWYNGSNFAMYIRRDIPQQLWDYGPEAIAMAGPLPGDEYLERWEQTRALDSLGSFGTTLGQLQAPKGVAVDAAGNIYVADSYNHRIQMFDPNGNPIRQWGSQGSAPGQFNEPWGVGVAPDGNIYVADTWNHRIQVFDPEGNFLTMWGGPDVGQVSQITEGGSQLYGPRDIAFDSQGRLYVSDTGNKRIIQYDLQGNLLGAVGGLGDGDGQLQEPVGIAVDADDNLYVADTWNQRVQVFGPDLQYLRQWHVYAWEGLSVVNKPYLAVDGAGNVYVTDPEQARVLLFNASGELVKAWGQYGSDLTSMDLPTGIAVDGAGRVIVGDSSNHRILVFEGPA
jgi:DNA-binding beta-propeller fold protein YncE